VSALPADEERPPRLAWGMLKRSLLGSLAIVLLTAGGVSSALLLELKGSVDIFEENSVPIEGGVEQALAGVAPDKPRTIVLLGSDRRYEDKLQGKPVRSDTLILVRLDPDKGATAVMNIPRDLRVDIPGEGRMKINEAYARGGAKLTIRTLSRLLEIPIHHVVVVNFGGFKRAVNRLGCVYVDVDRRYFNSNKGVPVGQRYAAIDIPAGYQRLCGGDSLDFVRHRHSDNDFVRAARQQEYLRQAKDQIGISKLVSDRTQLLEIFGRYTSTDANLRGDRAVLRVLKLAFEASKNPIRKVRFRAEIDPTNIGFVVASRADVRRTVREFLAVRASGSAGAGPERSRPASRSARRSRSRRASRLPEGLVAARDEGQRRAVELAFGTKMPVYYPAVRLARGGYASRGTRAYTIRDRAGKPHAAYRMVLVADQATGQYYGVQGTSWMAPPLLDDPTEVRRSGGRELRIFRDGRRIRLVAWRTKRAVYWVSNTLTQDLTNAQMLGIARSLTRVGR
jgi:LCP family protein required for cell wall assembly